MSTNFGLNVDAVLGTKRADRIVYGNLMDSIPNALQAVAAADNKYWALVGTNAADSDAAVASDGGITLTVNTTGDDEVCLVANTYGSFANVVPTYADKPAIVTIFKTSATITNTQWGFGLGSDDDGDAMFDNDGGGELDFGGTTGDSIFGFTYDTDDSDSYIRYAWIDDSAGTNTSIEANTNVTYAASTLYMAAVWFDEDGRANYFLQKDGGTPWKTRVETDLSGTSNVLGPFQGVSCLDTAAAAVTLKDWRFGIDI